MLLKTAINGTTCKDDILHNTWATFFAVTQRLAQHFLIRSWQHECYTTFCLVESCAENPLVYHMILSSIKSKNVVVELQVVMSNSTLRKQMLK